MDAGQVSTLKSKKLLSSPAPSDREVSVPSLDPLSVKTPGKPVDQPRRLRNRGVAFSVEDVRKAAMKLRERVSDPPPSADALSISEEPEIAKLKKSAAAEVELPAKYELLEKFFNSLDSSIRLLQLKRSATTFSNINAQIGTLTDRRFTYRHLAQLKFILPEAIVLEKTLQHDERTSCMKPDLRITLDVEAIKSKGKSKSGNLQLRKVFRNRLLHFFKSHPEGDEVPEEMLPEPFNRSKEANSTQPSGTSSTGQTRGVASPGLSVRASLLPPSFKRSFSQRDSGHQVEKLKQELSSLSGPALPSTDSEDNHVGGSFHHTEDSEIARISAGETCSSYEDSLSSEMPSTFPNTPNTQVKSINTVKDDDMNSVIKTPVNMSSTPMSAMPALQSAKRCNMSPDKDSCRTPSKLVRRPPPNRHLKFDTPVKSVNNDGNNDGLRGPSSARGDIFNILPESLIQSIQEKERLASIEQEPAISQAMRRRKMIACLPKLFDKIYFFFQSIRRAVVTKEELIQKLISQLDIVDKEEVEEQLRLLQELAPEWIYEKPALSGDLLLCINKISSPEAMRMRLSEAI
ncbi:CDT1-like protein a, chloroplastic isoform X2 [Salvia hispanica]|uniref:CDT1-like protein a, chloroplastic isoform X2 n=1 Tax=Salvia hispanica TaxID=49212 RepID=UPI0020091E53|nr:CDT1-like protein a, chloroplastic isoform X2 [Salvia hispanica]